MTKRKGPPIDRQSRDEEAVETWIDQGLSPGRAFDIDPRRIDVTHDEEPPEEATTEALLRFRDVCSKIRAKPKNPWRLASPTPEPPKAVESVSFLACDFHPSDAKVQAVGWSDGEKTYWEKNESFVSLCYFMQTRGTFADARKHFEACLDMVCVQEIYSGDLLLALFRGRADKTDDQFNVVAEIAGDAVARVFFVPKNVNKL